MTKLRSIATVATIAAAVFASSAQAQDGGWNTKYGMIFTVQNVFQNSSASELSDLGGSVGLQYNLGPQRAVRLQLNLSRASEASYIEERTVTDGAGGSTTTKTFHAAAPWSSQYEVGLGATYLVRLTSSALSPYLGAGLGLGFTQNKLDYNNDVNPANVVDVNNTDRTFDFGGQGLLGVEWRVHKSISLFAEYALGLTLVSYTSSSDETATTTTVGTTTVKTTSSHKNFFDFGTGIGQGGLLGLVAYF